MSLTKHGQKCPRNCTMNTKSTNFLKKWTKFQTKAQKCWKVHFIQEIWCSNRETRRFDEKLGDSRENWESWQVWIENTRKACKSQAKGEWFTSFSSVLPTSQVGYDTSKPTESVVYCFYKITLSKTMSLPAQ